ncbi:hypothetical protein ACFL3U_05010 [Pseudomonadota bacterium]
MPATSVMTVTTNQLKLLAALLWYSGGVVLFFKGRSLLLAADALAPDSQWFWLAILIGIFIGLLKVIFIFRKVCRKNLTRIYALSQPKIWQFYRTGFYIFLTCMIVLGSSLSHAAQGDFTFLICMAILDFSLSVALLGSSYVFWIYKQPANQQAE